MFGKDDIAYQIGETTQILSGGYLCATPHCVQVISRILNHSKLFCCSHTICSGNPILANYVLYVPFLVFISYSFGFLFLMLIINYKLKSFSFIPKKKQKSFICHIYWCSSRLVVLFLIFLNICLAYKMLSGVFLFKAHFSFYPSSFRDGVVIIYDLD